MTGRPDTRAAAAAGGAERADWEQRIYQRTDGLPAAGAGRPDEPGVTASPAALDGMPALPAPAEVTATAGAGHIRLDWQPVPGAAGYLIERSSRTEPPQVLRHGGSDVAAVAGPPFADTGLADRTDYRYRIGAVAGPEYPAGRWSESVWSRTADGQAGSVRVAVHAATGHGQLHRVWQMVGAERLSQLRLGTSTRGSDGRPGSNGRPDAAGAAGTGSGSPASIAAEFAEALRLARSELGATMVRAHAILHDDNAVVRRDPAGALRFDFSRIDAIYDHLLRLGLRPVVELSFMPAALAADPAQTVFTYRGIISPPADWGEWRALVIALTGHLVGRYGIDEVAQWAFEVWNEPNLVVFWPGSRDDYLRLYSESACAIKSVDPRLRVGGPSTAAAEWVELLAAHARRTGVALDFVSTHTYGNLPLDFRPSLRRHGLGGRPIWWTEWGIGSTHFGPVHDSVLGAPFVLSGLLSAQGRVDAVAYWVISDHFEELGRPPRLFHNGFGLLTVGNLRKPRYWAQHLAAQLGDQVLGATAEGDGAGTLVQSWAARHDDGTVDVLVWNGTINTELMAGDPRLDRQIELTVTGLTGTRYQPWLARIDERHSNVVACCPAGVTWPDQALWARLRASDELHTERLPEVRPEGGTVRFRFDLPMPAVVRIRLAAGPPAARHG